jgi:hypothetical protein
MSSLRIISTRTAPYDDNLTGAVDSESKQDCSDYVSF